jgi:hypothetical protein
MNSGIQYMARCAAVGLLLALTACGSSTAANIPTSTPGAASVPVATAAATAQPAPTAAAATTAQPAPTAVVAPTSAPAATAAPTAVPEPAQWTEYRDALGRWMISYPANVLSPVDIDDGLIVFISQDRGFFVGVDSRASDSADAEVLRARATKALTQIYSSRPKTITKLEQTDAPWQAGVRFATAKGSEGIAVYTLAGSEGGKWAYGMIYGYKTAGSPKLREALEQTIAKLQLNPPTAGSANSAQDLPVEVQQPIVDAAFAALRARGERAKLAIGLVDVTGDRAAVLARPFGKEAITIALTRRGGTWRVVPATETPGGDSFTVIDLALKQLQDPRGQGMNAYVTRPRLAGDFARFTVSPADSEQRDGGAMFFKREGDAWHFLTGGTAFLEDDLRGMGVPQELWSYGNSVHGPA